MILATFDRGGAFSAPGPGLGLLPPPRPGLRLLASRCLAPNADLAPGFVSELRMKNGAEDAHKAQTLRRGFVRIVRIGAAIDAVGHQARIVLHRRVVPDKLRLGPDRRQRAAVAERKQPAEVV